MSCINFALNELKMRIPLVVLKEAFKDDVVYYNSANVSLDEQIKNKVIKQRVLPVCNIVGGQQVVIDLAGLTPISLDTNVVVYEIPHERTSYKEIMSVLSVSFSNTPMSFGNLAAPNNSIYGGNYATSAALKICEGLSPIPSISTASCELIGHNTVLIRDPGRTNNLYQLRCMLSNDPNMNNIQQRSWLAFSRLVELAVKSYVYNTLIIKIDMAYLTGGQELGMFKSIVEGYSDSEQMFQDYIKETWQAVSVFNDTWSSDRLLRLQIPSSL